MHGNDNYKLYSRSIIINYQRACTFCILRGDIIEKEWERGLTGGCSQQQQQASTTLNEMQRKKLVNHQNQKHSSLSFACSCVGLRVAAA
jgi:hypothetical protein